MVYPQRPSSGFATFSRSREAKELGVVLLHPKKRAEASGGFRLTTSNRMEIFAAIVGLEILKQPCKVTLNSDSQYLVDAI